MATPRKPANRIMLTISDDLRDALAELNATTGVAAATFLSEIMEAQTEMVWQIAEAARQATSEPNKALEIIQGALLDASCAVNEQQREVLETQSRLRTYGRKDVKN